MDSNTLPIISTDRVVLRWVSENDIDSLYEVFSDPQVMRYWSTAPFTDREAAVNLQREIAAGNETNTMMKWGLALRDSDRLIGTTTLFNLNLDNGRAELGYAMGADGFMSKESMAGTPIPFDQPRPGMTTRRTWTIRSGR